MCQCWRFRCCRTWRTIHHRPTLTLFPRQVTRTLVSVFFAVCHKVKFIEATKHFRPLLENDASRKPKLPTSDSCPADLAVSDPELASVQRDERRACRLKPPAARTGRATHSAAEKVHARAGTGRCCGEGLRTAEGHWVAVPTSPCTRHSEACRVQRAEKPTTESTDSDVDWANQELRNLRRKTTHCQCYQVVDQELGECACFAAMVDKFGCSYDLQRANVYAGKCDKMGGFMGVMKCHDQRKRILSFRYDRTKTVFAEKRALHSAESQECEFVGEEPADDHRPHRDAQQTLENAVPSKNTGKSKATYTQCLPQHTRVLCAAHACCGCCMVRVFVCVVFGLIRSRGKDRAVSKEARRQQRVSSHYRFC